MYNFIPSSIHIHLFNLTLISKKTLKTKINVKQRNLITLAAYKLKFTVKSNSLDTSYNCMFQSFLFYLHLKSNYIFNRNNLNIPL